MEHRSVALLILAAGFMPFVWGWTVYWLVSRLWPENRIPSSKPRMDAGSPPPLDYQI